MFRCALTSFLKNKFNGHVLGCKKFQFNLHLPQLVNKNQQGKIK